MKVTGHQRSNGVNYVLWLPYFVKRSADASWEWWWPLWRSEVITGQMGWTMCYGYYILSKEALMQAENDDDPSWRSKLSEVKYGKLCDMATIFGQKTIPVVQWLTAMIYTLLDWIQLLMGSFVSWYNFLIFFFFFFFFKCYQLYDIDKKTQHGIETLSATVWRWILMNKVVK